MGFERFGRGQIYRSSQELGEDLRWLFEQINKLKGIKVEPPLELVESPTGYYLKGGSSGGGNYVCKLTSVLNAGKTATGTIQKLTASAGSGQTITFTDGEEITLYNPHQNYPLPELPIGAYCTVGKDAYGKWIVQSGDCP